MNWEQVSEKTYKRTNWSSLWIKFAVQFLIHFLSPFSNVLWKTIPWAPMPKILFLLIITSFDSRFETYTVKGQRNFYTIHVTWAMLKLKTQSV